MNSPPPEDLQQPRSDALWDSTQSAQLYGINAWGAGEEKSDPIPLIGGEKYYIMAI